MAFADIFGSVGVGEWLVLLAVVLIVTGPKRLPGTVRKFGRLYGRLRRAADSFRRQLMDMEDQIDAAQDIEES